MEYKRNNKIKVMVKQHSTEKKACSCYNCGKKSMRTYNFTLKKWAREFKYSCGSMSFRWSNW